MKITKTNYEEYALDFIEGTLSREDRRAFERFLEENPDIAGQIHALAEELPVLLPDLSVRFEDKASLKRRTSIRSMIVRIGSVAAALLIGVLLFNRYSEKEPGTDQPLVTQVPVVEYPVQPESPVTGDSVPVSDPAETPNLVADLQKSPVPSKVKSPAESAAKTVDADPKRSLMPENAMGQPALKNQLQVAEKKQEPNNLQQKDSEDYTGQDVLSVLPENKEDLLQGWNNNVKTTVLSLGLESETELEVSLAQARNEQVIFSSEEYVVEQTNELVLVLETRDYFAEEKDKAGFLNVFNKKGIRRLATGILTPLSELNPIKVYDSNEERVIEFASIPVSRKNKQQVENEQIKNIE